MRGKPEKLSHKCSRDAERLKRSLQLTLLVYRDCAAISGLSPSHVERDCEVIRQRTAKEGMSFLTKTLPSLGKCLDKALSRDIPLPKEHSFQISGKDTYPLFLRGFWRIIFSLSHEDTLDSVPRIVEGKVSCHDTNLDPQGRIGEAVRAVRQICYLWYKLEGSHSAESELEVIRGFIATEALLPDFDDVIQLSDRTYTALESAKCLVHYALRDLDLVDILPKHGPGAVATGEKQWEKFNFSRYYGKLDEEYCYADYFFYNYNHLALQLQSLDELVEDHEPTAKVVLVPKDSRGPRLISMEPLELQWIQQGQMRSLVKHLEGTFPTAGFVNFTTQEVNRRLAFEHSGGLGYMATLDMKDASDRVSVWLLKQLLPETIFRKLMASRSDYTRLPDGQRLRLKKFAPMGSAVCFPLEALCFWALAVGTLVDCTRARGLYRLPSVYVFGDDIVLPQEGYDPVRQVYSDLFLRVNEDKCCVGRFFRESCGMDAYICSVVTPIRHRKHCTASPDALLANTAYANAHVARGHGQAAAFLIAAVEHECGMRVPVTNVEGKHPFAYFQPELTNEEVCKRNSCNFRTRYNKALQRHEIRVMTPFTPDVHREVPHWHELWRRGLGGPQDPFGFLSIVFEPCVYQLAKATRFRWAWVDVSQLAGV